MRKKEKIVLDTSIFVNAQTIKILGRNPDEAFHNFLEKTETIQGLKFYMPPSVKEELLRFLDETKIDKKKLIRIKTPSPKKYEIKIPALFLYELIEQTRIRTNKGLRIAEKAARKTLKEGNEEKIIQQLRQEYRVALREGIIDSTQDLDLVLLAKQLNAVLASEDAGLKEWAQKLGIETWSLKELKNILDANIP